MKKYIIPVMAAFILLGCNGFDDGRTVVKDDGIVVPEGMVPLTVFAHTLSTKAEASPAEKNISNIQIFIYNNEEGGNGELETSARATSPNHLLVSTRGPKSIYILVNVPVDYTTDDAIENYGLRDSTNLRALKTDLSDNRTNSFVMVGKKDYVVSKAATVTVDVKRLVCKISFNKIKADLDASVASLYRYAEFDITKIYLRNCVAKQDFSLSNSAYWATGAKWYNKTKLSTSGDDCFPSAASNLILREFSLNEIKLFNQPDPANPEEKKEYNTAIEFYVYPNGAGNDFNETTWTARRTCLVVVANIKYNGGNLPNRHFVVPLGAGIGASSGKVEGALEANKQYNVTLTMKSIGNDADNDKNPYTSNVNNSVAPLDWEDVESYDFESN